MSLIVQIESSTFKYISKYWFGFFNSYNNSDTNYNLYSPPVSKTDNYYEPVLQRSNS